MINESEARMPIGEALHGLRIMPMPEGWTPLEGIALVKCIDEDGDTTWALRTTDGINDEELLGALVIRTDLLRRDLVRAFEDD